MSTTYTTTQPRVTHRAARTVGLGAALIAIAALGIAAMLALSTTPGRSDRAVTAESAGLSPQQIVIRGEVQDRLSAQAESESAGLTPQQIVIRGEVRDRLSAQAESESAGLTPQQIVIRGEVRDRLGS